MLFERPLIAVDIGSSSIKMMELKRSGTSYAMKSFAIQPLPEGAIEDGAIQNNAIVKDVIHSIATQLGVKGRRAAISLSGSGVLIRRVTVPVGKDVILEEQIPFYAEQAFQLDPSGLYYDFVKVPRQKSESEVEVLLVGARREIVESYVVCVREAGLRLGVIECNAFSLFNAFEKNYGSLDGLVCLINVGASSTQITFLLDGHFLFSRDIALAGSTYTRRMTDMFQISFAQADRQKIMFSMTGKSSRASDILNIMRDVNDQIVHEVTGTLSYFIQTGDVPSDQTLRYVFVTGGASRTPELDQALASALKVPIYQLNPFQRISSNKAKIGMEEIGLQSPLLAIAAGLSLRKMEDKDASAA